MSKEYIKDSYALRQQILLPPRPPRVAPQTNHQRRERQKEIISKSDERRRSYIDAVQDSMKGAEEMSLFERGHRDIERARSKRQPGDIADGDTAGGDGEKDTDNNDDTGGNGGDDNDRDDDDDDDDDDDEDSGGDETNILDGFAHCNSLKLVLGKSHRSAFSHRNSLEGTSTTPSISTYPGGKRHSGNAGNDGRSGTQRSIDAGDGKTRKKHPMGGGETCSTGSDADTSNGTVVGTVVGGGESGPEHEHGHEHDHEIASFERRQQNGGDGGAVQRNMVRLASSLHVPAVHDGGGGSSIPAAGHAGGNTRRRGGGGRKGHTRREEQLLDNGLVKLITRHHSLWSVSLAVQSLGASRLCLLATVDCRASCDNTVSDQVLKVTSYELNGF